MVLTITDFLLYIYKKKIDNDDKDTGEEKGEWAVALTYHNRLSVI